MNRSDDPADLFCQLHDELSDAALSRDRAWRRNAHLDALTAEVRGFALDLRLDPPWLASRLQEIGKRVRDEQAATWAAARGLDQALAECHPTQAAPAGQAMPSALKRQIGSRYTAKGRLDTGAAGGALLPKLVETGRRGESTANRSQAFAAVHRVSAAAFDSPHVDFSRVSSAHDPVVRARDGTPGVVVAFAPMLGSLGDDLHLEPKDDEGAHFFVGTPIVDVVKERIRTVLRRMDESGAMLGICPELALSEDLLDEWRLAVKERDGRAGSSLEWIFVGSGPFSGPDGAPPYNRGVLLNRRTGRAVYSQDKLFPFTLMPEQSREWGLRHKFKTRVDEWMTAGDKLRIRETGWGRLAILICEDLAKLLEEKVGRLIADFGVSMVIAPVFSKEVEKFRWEHQQSRAYADQLGTMTAVANSLVVPRAVGARGDVGTCLVNAPGAVQIGRSRHADQISVFWLTARGVEAPSTHPVVTDELGR